MGMINSRQLLAAFTHGALRGKQIFGGGFVSHQRIGSDVSQRIDCRRFSVSGAADEPAAFAGGFTPCMIKNFVNVRLLNREGHDSQRRFVALPLDVRKGSAFP